MLEPQIGGLYVHIFKTRHVNHIKTNTEIPKWDPENPMNTLCISVSK